MGWGGGLGVIIECNLNRVRLSCCWVGVGLGCDNTFKFQKELFEDENDKAHITVSRLS